MARVLRVAATIIAAVGLFALGFAVNDLEDGIVEAPMHWWSTLPLLALAGAALLWLSAARHHPDDSAA